MNELYIFIFARAIHILAVNFWISGITIITAVLILSIGNYSETAN